MSEPIKLQTCTVSHRHGTDTFSCLGTEQDIKRHVGDTYCAEWWGELNGTAGFMPADGECIFDLYFEYNDRESADLSAIDLHTIKGGIVLGFTNQELERVMKEESSPTQVQEAMQMFEKGMTPVEHEELRTSIRDTIALEMLNRAACS